MALCFAPSFLPSPAVCVTRISESKRRREGARWLDRLRARATSLDADSMPELGHGLGKPWGRNGTGQTFYKRFSYCTVRTRGELEGGKSDGTKMEYSLR